MRTRAVLSLAVVLPIVAQAQANRIGTIDFYGYGTLVVAPLRAALPFKQGDKTPTDAVKAAAERAVREIAGREVKISDVCCPAGRTAIFVGLAEPDAPTIPFNPGPKGQSKLPPEALKIFKQLDSDIVSAINRGDSQEDDSQGYALFRDPAANASALKLRAWARANTAVILHVLTDSRDPNQRAFAAEALGYADRGPEQIAALVTAAFDADDLIRNNAVRALVVLCTIGEEVIRQIPAARFIPLLRSIAWKDRNKAAGLLVALTATRDPTLLKTLHDQAFTSLREMAQWKDFDHARASLVMLGRIGGIEETRLQRMEPASTAEILASVR